MEKHLITGATTARAQQLARSLDPRVVKMADYTPVPEPLLKSGKFIQLASPEKDIYVHELLKVCLDVQAAYLHVVRPDEAGLLQGHEKLFEEYGIQIIIED